ncbi:putative non-specific serine/threonine protein kinase [Helianthus anomalus]
MRLIQPILIVSFVFVLLIPIGKTETEDVVEALVDFMQKLGPGSMRNTPNWGWNTTSDPCIANWHGVMCDSTKQIVKNIVLEQISLSGTVDFQSVCKETSILLLSLRYNNLTGSLPQKISHCKRLRLLYLNGNHFSGDLPGSLSGLTDLLRIDISNNELSGELPDVSRNTRLLVFLAQNNHFTGQLPDFNYHQLEDFDVSNNDLSGRIPDDTGIFGAKSFAGNPRLCGKVLSKPCP